MNNKQRIELAMATFEVGGDYEKRVAQLEAEGMTTSDAQGVADAEILSGGLKLEQ